MIDRLFKNNHGHRWSNDEIRTLMRMWAEDKSLNEISEELKVTKTAAQRMIVRLRSEGIPLKRRTRGNFAGRRNSPWSQSQIEYLLRRRKERATIEEIANELERSVMSINSMIQTLRKEGVAVPNFGSGCRRKWNPVVAMASMQESDKEGETA
jgi:biotin operon repressor